MKKSRARKVTPSARRLPTRSVVKKARVNEAISVEDDYPDEVSPCSPIEGVPVSKNVPASAVKESLTNVSKVIFDISYVSLIITFLFIIYFFV